MSQKLPGNNFGWIKDTSQFNENSIKDYDEESQEGYFLVVDVQYPEKLHDLHYDLPFLLGKMKIEKVEKLVANLYDKTEYVIRIRNLKQALNNGLLLKKVHRVIKFNKNIKSDFEKKIDLMNNAVFGKTMENVRKHRGIKLVTTERRKNYLVLERNFYTAEFFTDSLLAVEIKRQRYL